MSANLDALIPELQSFARDLIQQAGAAGLMPRVTSTLRTKQEQTRLYRRYLQGLNTLPVAPPGTSAHEYGFAFDLIVTPFEALSDLGNAWEAAGGVWGGEFNDPVHFEYPGFKEWLKSNAPSGLTATDVVDFVGSNLPGGGIVSPYATGYQLVRGLTSSDPSVQEQNLVGPLYGWLQQLFK